MLILAIVKSIGVFLCRLVEQWPDHLAGSTPLRPEIEQIRVYLSCRTSVSKLLIVGVHNILAHRLLTSTLNDGLNSCC